jgi:hypothetical protein
VHLAQPGEVGHAEGDLVDRVEARTAGRPHQHYLVVLPHLTETQ